MNKKNKIDIVEFVEKFCGVKLFDWQKEYLKKTQDLPPNLRVVMGRGGHIHIIGGHK